jgi:biotin synthase
MTDMSGILLKTALGKEDIQILLAAGEDDSATLFGKAAETKKAFVENKVYFRGLIEYSNYCIKNCYYCGIRSGNVRDTRYEMTKCCKLPDMRGKMVLPPS